MDSVFSVVLRVNDQLSAGVQRATAAVEGFGRSLQQRLETTRVFNASISNGDVALRQWGGALAAIVGGAALRNYMAEAEAAAQAQAQLNQALAARGQLGFRDALTTQAAALQHVTLFSEEAIMAVQRTLVTFGASGDKAIALTEGVLNLAQATGQSAEAAAQLVGRTLRGDSDELGRYQIALDQTAPRIDAITQALSGFARGAARGAVADGAAREAKVRLAEAGEQVGAAALRAKDAFLAGLAPAIERVASLANALGPTLASIATQLGDLVGKTGLWVAALLAIGPASNLLSALINPLRSLFVLIAGVPISTLQLFTRELGLIQTFSLANWGQRIAAGFSLIGAAMLGWQAGLAIGNAINSMIDEMERRVRGLRSAFADEPLRLTTIIEQARTSEQFEAGLANARERAQTVAEEIAALEARAAQPASSFSVPGGSLAATAARSTQRAGLGREDQARLEALRDELALLRQIDQALPARKDEILTGNNEADRLAAQAQEAEDAAAAQAQAERAARSEIFDLQTQLLSAEAAGDTAQAERLQRTIAERQVALAAAQEGQAAIQARIEAMRALAQAEDAAAATAQRRQEQEATLARELGDLVQERARIEADRFLTAEEKQAQLNRLLDRENALLQEKLDKLDAIIAAEADPALRLELRRERDTTAQAQARNRGDRAEGEPLGVGGNIIADLKAQTDEWGTSAQRVANLFTRPIRAGIRAAQAGMNQLLGTTTYWQQKLGNIGGAVMGAITSAITEMFAAWLTGMITSFVTEKVFRQQRKAETAAELPMKMMDATATSISSFGVAAVLGLALMLAAIAAIGSFESGGPTGGRRGRTAGIVHGEEFVFSAEAVDALGLDYLEQLHSAARSGSSPARAGAPPAAGGKDQPIIVQVGLLNHRSEQRRFARQEGAKIAYDFHQRRQRRI